MSGYGRWVRWVLLSLTATMGLLLGGTLWLSQTSVDDASKRVVEFEPTIADQLRVTSHRTLAAGAGAIVALSLTALVLASLLRQRDALEVRHERDRRLAALGEMSAVLAHELRNPLASLKGHAQLLVEALPDDGRARGKAERVVREAQRLEALSNDLLEFVRAGQIARRPIDPAELLYASADTLDPSRIDLDLDGAPERWSLDPLKMRQVLVTVLDNALNAAGPPGGTSRASAAVRVDGDRLTFEVRDFGGGIPPGDEERIFEPFSTTRVHGTGLGLFVTRRIVELHRGVITAHNHPDGGAIFQISIPAG